jgi:hypothetical protein
MGGAVVREVAAAVHFLASDDASYVVCRSTARGRSTAFRRRPAEPRNEAEKRNLMVNVGLLISGHPPVDAVRSASDLLRFVRRPNATGSPWRWGAFLYGDLRWLSRCPCSPAGGRGRPRFQTCHPDHHRAALSPVLLPRRSPLDIVTEGRLIFGAGGDIGPEEFTFLDVLQERRPLRRVAQADDQAWTQETVTHHGRFWNLDGVSRTSSPPAAALPIWIGPMPRPASVARQNGDAYACPPETPVREVARRYAIVRDGFAARGKAFTSQPLRRNIQVGDTREEAMVEYARVAQGRYLTYLNKGLDVMADTDLENSSRGRPHTPSSAPTTRWRRVVRPPDAPVDPICCAPPGRRCPATK